MIAPKYISDYYLDVSKDDNGKVTRTNVYIGPLYELQVRGGASSYIRDMIIIVAAVVITTISFLYGLSFYNGLSRVWYTSLPYAAVAAGLIMITDSIFKIKKPGIPMERITRDRGVDRLKSASVISIILVVISVVGALVALTEGRVSMDPGNGIYLAMLAIQLLGLATVLVTALRFTTIEVENPEASLYRLKAEKDEA